MDFSSTYTNPPFRNSGLFSNYYLTETLPKEGAFDVPDDLLNKFKDEIKSIFDAKYLSSLNEAQLREHFLNKIFKLLDWTIDVEPPIPSGGGAKHPDYVLFSSNSELKSAQKLKKQNEYFPKALCIAEAKQWGKPLDRKLRDEKDPLEVLNPSLQISQYLWLSGVKWGILTDGKYWRLYERETSKRLDIFYQIDLELLIEKGSEEDLKYFYLFFRKDAFPNFLDMVLRGSIDYTKAVGQELKDNVYYALKYLADGFLKNPSNNLNENDLKEIFDNCLILLYRFLFILYAEYRGLLPRGENRLYTEKFSLEALKKEAALELDDNRPLAASAFAYWDKAKSLFRNINEGNPELGIPPYNGGLFNPDKHGFLEKNIIGDRYLAKAIDLLTRAKNKAFIDYGSLEIRHLGSIYEGLLEYQLKIAEQDIVPVKDKGKEIYKPIDKAKSDRKKIKFEDVVERGSVYLVNNKGERKSTGSYYTPDYVVRYIVENTLSPIVKEKLEKIEEKSKELENKIKKARGYNRKQYEIEFQKNKANFKNEILSVKILDPAMGSGHFLVEATDFLAREILGRTDAADLTDFEENYQEEDIRRARREVVEKCIFGVDINPLAVELAKLSLWLYTVAKDKPLNFLDHHLRCGNSLIGANLDDLAAPPFIKNNNSNGKPRMLGYIEDIFKTKVNILLGAFKQIESIPSETVEQVREKEKLYNEFRKIVSRFQDVADVWTSYYFCNKFEYGDYKKLQDNLPSPEAEWEKLARKTFLQKAKEITKEKKFFHWEMEFPEIFFEGHQRKEKPGFDCIMGNPPYGFISDKTFLEDNYHVISRNFNIYAAFIEKCISLLSDKGYFSLITPVSWQTGAMYKCLRDIMLENIKIEYFINLPFNVFKDAYIDTCIFVGKKSLLQVEKDYASFVYEFPKYHKLESLGSINYNTVNVADWVNNVNKKIILNNTLFSLLMKFQNINFTTLGKLSISARGVLAENKHISKIIKHGFQPFFNGEMLRYYISDPDMFINYSDDLPESPSSFDFFVGSRVLVRRLISRKDRLMAAVVQKTFVNKKDIYLIKPLNDISSTYLLALINSKLLSYIYFHSDTIAQKDDFRQTTLDGLRNLPFPVLDFSTDVKNRMLLLEEIIKLHQSYEYEKALNIVTNKVKSVGKEILYDVLSFLASQMLEMEKTKYNEVNGFLRWLEREIGTEIDTLKNKSIFKKFHQESFISILDNLKKNKNILSIDPSQRKFQELLEESFIKSVSELDILMSKIKETDDLIDKFVYQLYGLTDDEIKLVDSSFES